ncbi:MAG TPA: hypothetical protein PLJ84_00070 [Bacteroidales bacterium]|nr:hypothetical protein [Bacteroidales bacterium]HPT00964.1 hypothetical protein [Bacteroidales bacterium]
MDTDNEQSLERLRILLEKNFSWPSVYMFKLIIPADNRIFAMVKNLFPEEARFFIRNSKSGKYIIITVKELMLNPEEVIARYREALEIEGIIML